MGSNHADNPQTGFTVGSQPQGKYTSAVKTEVENHLKNLEKLVDSVHADCDQMSLSGKSPVLRLVHEFRAKIKASQDKVRVAKLLSEPARGSIFSKVRDSLTELEEVVASHLGVRTN